VQDYPHGEQFVYTMEIREEATAELQVRPKKLWDLWALDSIFSIEMESHSESLCIYPAW